MDEKRLHDILIQNINHLMEQEQNHAPSMRYLSTCIDANEGYIQKVMTGSFPSLEKLTAIANHYDVEPWTLLYDFQSDDTQLLSIAQQLSSCSPEMQPLVLEFIKYLKSIDGQK